METEESIQFLVFKNLMMGTLWFGEIRKQASSFIQDKYNVARLVLTDVTEAELWVYRLTKT